jgi:chromosome segregation ATPase
MEPAPGTSDKEALRIQAAAVAAQQAALAEEEARLQQRRGALEQQEAQLAAHLEDKQQRLVRLREEAQSARAALQQERASYLETVAQTRRELSEAQKEVQQAREQVRAERQRLIDLRRRLKHRWHRHWLAERRAQRRCQHELVIQRNHLDKEWQRLQQDRADLAQAGLRARGEAELGKRQLRAEWHKLYQERQAWQTALSARTRALAQRETAVAQAERDLLYDRHQWQGFRLGLEREAAGLEARVRNQRSKFLQQQQELSRLDAALSGFLPAVSTTLPLLAPVTIVPMPSVGGEADAQGAIASVPPGEPAAEEQPNAQARLVLPAPEQEAPPTPYVQTAGAASAYQRRLVELERLAGDLADQRLQLAEQWQRLAQAQHRWQEARDTAAAELEALTAGLPERERALSAREQGLEATECDLRRRHVEVAHLRHHLDAWQARLRVHEGAWEAERDRLLAEVRAREVVAERLEANLVELRQRWARRRRQELDRLCGERAACARAHREWVGLREDWWRRHTALEEKRRALAEKELALEACRQEFLTGTADAAAAERGAERLRRRWTRLHAAAIRATAVRRQKLAAHAVQLETRYEAVQKQAEAVTQREVSLAEQHAALEHREALARAQQHRAEQEMQRIQAQCDRYEQQNGELQEEVDRVARLLLEGPEDNPVPVERAA